MNSIMRWDFILGSPAANRFLTNFGKNGFPDIYSFKLILQGNISKLRTNACEREYSNIFLLARRLFTLHFREMHKNKTKISIKNTTNFPGIQKVNLKGVAKWQ